MAKLMKLKKLLKINMKYLKTIKNSKKPLLIILGQSALRSKSGKYIFESIKSFLKKNNKINR